MSPRTARRWPRSAGVAAASIATSTIAASESAAPHARAPALSKGVTEIKLGGNVTDSVAGEPTEKEHLPDLLQIALVLFPGFLTLRVSEYFAFSPKLDGVELIASAVAATVLDF